MVVLLTTPSLEQPGGVAHCYRVLQPHLDSGVEYLTVGTRTPGEGGLRRGWRMLRDYLRFCRRLRAGRHDLVHLNPSLCLHSLLRDGLFLLLAKALGKKVLVFWHGWNPACEAALRRRFLPLFRWVYFRADAFIVLASRFQSVLREFGYTRPIYLQTMVVSDEVFSLAARPPADTAGRDPLNILFLSRLERTKGIYEAIEAFRLLRERHPGVRLTIAGDGAELGAAREDVRTRNLEDVTFLGWVQGPAKLQAFAQADIYLFPSHHEGMPTSVLEAMACGLPVITRPVGGLCDFFEDGAMGFLTESHDPAVFASLLERLVLDPSLRQAMARHNRSYARQNFTAAAVARRLAETYRSAACKRSTP